jgi:hypothetical protein
MASGTSVISSTSQISSQTHRYIPRLRPFRRRTVAVHLQSLNNAQRRDMGFSILHHTYQWHKFMPNNDVRPAAPPHTRASHLAFGNQRVRVLKNAPSTCPCVTACGWYSASGTSAAKRWGEGTALRYRTGGHLYWAKATGTHRSTGIAERFQIPD